MMSNLVHRESKACPAAIVPVVALTAPSTSGIAKYESSSLLRVTPFRSFWTMAASVCVSPNRRRRLAPGAYSEVVTAKLTGFGDQYLTRTFTATHTIAAVNATVAAENYIINPKGDPYEVGSNGPAPNGVYHVGPVLHWDETAKDKQSYGTEGVIALSGPGNSNLAQERLIRIHAGEDAYFARGASDNYDHAWTEGCIRVSEQTMVLLERTLNPNPSQNTLIIK